MSLIAGIVTALAMINSSPVGSNIPVKSSLMLPGLITVRQEWQYWMMGAGIGDAGLQIADLDSDGKNEVIASASPGTSGKNRFWYVLEKKEDGTYSQKWTSELYPTEITCLRVFDYDLNGQPDIVIATAGTLHVYHGDTKSEIATLATTAPEIKSLNFSNVDSDPQPEFVFIDSDFLYIYSSTGVLEQKVAGFKGTDCVVGNVLPDRIPEIVIGNNSQTGYVLHGQTRQLIYNFPQGLGYFVRLADINGDGTSEIIAARNSGGVAAYSVGITRTPIWQTTTANDASDALTVGDIDSDGKVDVLVGYRQSAARPVFVLDGQTGALKSGIVKSEAGVTEIAVGNVDEDSAQEVIFGCGFSTSAGDYLEVHDGPTRALEFKSLDLNGYFRAMDFGDIDLDGTLDILLASGESDSRYEDGLVLSFNGSTRALQHIIGPISPQSSGEVSRICRANVDADPQSEIFIASSEGYDGVVVCLDGLTLLEQFRTLSSQLEEYCSLGVADVDADGVPEIVVGTRNNYSAGEANVVVFDATNGNLEWRSADYVGGPSRLRIANIDSDQALEIITCFSWTELVIIDGLTKSIVVAPGLAISSIETFDADQDGQLDIVIGESDGKVTQRDPDTGAVVSQMAQLGGSPASLRIVNVGGTPAPDYISVIGGRLTINYESSPGVQAVWQSELLDPYAGLEDTILVGDVDEDGRLEILVAEWQMGFRMFEIE